MQDQKASLGAPTPGSPQGTFAFGPYQLDCSNGVLSSNGAEIPLPPRVLRVLEQLLERPGEVVSKQELLDAVWPDTVVAETSLADAIKILRHALEDDPQQPTYLQTIHRRGYRFIAPVSAEAAILGGETVPGRLSPGHRYRLIGLGTAAAAVLVITTFLLWSWASREGLESSGSNGVASAAASEAALAFEERDWVLIAAFENRTGETLFDGTLEHALGSELSNSGFVNVVPRERIADTLRLMRKPADATVDAALGREISLRDGGIRALITGRVEKLDNTYLLSAALVNPADGVTVASFSEEAEGQKEVVPAVRRLSSRVREALGEALPLIRESEMSLAKVTTPSLRALQLYTQGDALNFSGQPAAAEELMRQAISEDPEFASAYIYLAHTISNQHRRRPNWEEELIEELLPYSQRAFELSDRTSERERYFIRASYFADVGQREKSVANYEALLQLDPDHYWANQNLAGYYLNFLDPPSIEEGLPYRLRTAQLRPNSFGQNFRAGQLLVFQMNRPREAEPYLQRAADLAETDPSAGGPASVAWARLYPAHRRWLEGDLEGALNEVDRWRETLKSSSGQSRNRLAVKMGHFYVALGMLEAAEEIFRFLDPATRDRYLHEVEYYRMDEKEGVAFLKRQGGLSLKQTLGVKRLARGGLLSEARNVLASFQARARARGPSAVRNAERSAILARGVIALAEGNAEEAISLLQEGLAPLRNSGNHAYFRCSESLAHAWELQGNLDMAVQTLEDASQQKHQAYPGGALSGSFGSPAPAKVYWMRVRLRLAQLYLKLGREAEALEIEAELRELLRYADPDLWLVRELEGLNGGRPTGTR